MVHSLEKGKQACLGRGDRSSLARSLKEYWHGLSPPAPVFTRPPLSLRWQIDSLPSAADRQVNRHSRTKESMDEWGRKKKKQVGCGIKIMQWKKKKGRNRQGWGGGGEYRWGEDLERAVKVNKSFERNWRSEEKAGGRKLSENNKWNRRQLRKNVARQKRTKSKSLRKKKKRSLEGICLVHPGFRSSSNTKEKRPDEQE